jgi:hypothetical protein
MAAPAHVALVRDLLFDGLSEEQVAMLEFLVGQVSSRLDQAEGPAGADKGSRTTP